MATIINNPPAAPAPQSESDNSLFGVLVGILLVVLIVLFLIFGWPALRGGNNTDTSVDTEAPTGTGGPSTNIEGDLDVNVY